MGELWAFDTVELRFEQVHTTEPYVPPGGDPIDYSNSDTSPALLPGMFFSFSGRVYNNFNGRKVGLAYDLRCLFADADAAMGVRPPGARACDSGYDPQYADEFAYAPYYPVGVLSSLSLEKRVPRFLAETAVGTTAADRMRGSRIAPLSFGIQDTPWALIVGGRPASLSCNCSASITLSATGPSPAR